MTLGDKIVELRKKFGLTQEKLSSRIGISRQTLSNWESDITSPDIKEAKELAQIFKVSLDDLVNNNTEFNCLASKNILKNIIDKNCYLDLSDDLDDYRITNSTLCKIVDINNNFLKVEFKYGKKTITKILDLNLVLSIKYYEEGI